MVFTKKIYACSLDSPRAQHKGYGGTEKNQFHGRDVGKLLYAHIEHRVKTRG
jgi:hypothetical protein